VRRHDEGREEGGKLKGEMKRWCDRE